MRSAHRHAPNRIGAAAAAVAVLLTTLAPAAFAQPAVPEKAGTAAKASVFADVDADHPFAAEIAWMAATGITRGCGSDGEEALYCPEEHVTRAQLAAFLRRAWNLWTAGENTTPAAAKVAALAGGFPDVGTGHLFAADIAWMADAGITRGCNPPRNDRFCPDDPVTRGQAAAFLNRTLGLPAGTAEYADVDDSHVFWADIAAIGTAGLSRGCGTSDAGTPLYCPEAPLTRGQMAAYLHRADKIADQYFQTGSAPLTLDIESTLTVVRDETFTHDLQVAGGMPPYEYSAAGLPEGVTLNTDGMLGGTPTTVGTYNATVTVSDSEGDSVSAELAIEVVAPELVIVTSALPAGIAVEETYSTTLEARGGTPPYVWRVEGLPAGMEATSDGEIGGTVTDSGAWPLTIQVTDANGTAAQAALTLTMVSPALCADVTAIPDVECVAALQILAAAYPGSEPAPATDNDFCDGHYAECEDGHLTRLSLPQFDDEYPTGTLSPAVAQLPALQVLEVLRVSPGDGSDPVLGGPVPAELGDLASLTKLDLPNQALEGTVPEEIGGLHSIETLNLSGNQLHGPVDVVAETLADTLEELDLGGNRCFEADPTNAATLDTLDPNWDDGCVTLEMTLMMGAVVGDWGSIGFGPTGGHGPYQWQLTGQPDWFTHTVDNPDGTSQTLGADPYVEAGEWEMTLTVTDAYGSTDSMTIPLEVTPAAGCEDNTTIPDLECAALRSFAQATNLGSDHGWSGGDPCEWKGVMCYHAGDRVTAIQINVAGGVTDGFDPWTVSGTLAPELRHLQALTELTVEHQHLTGTIPPELGELAALERLRLRDTELAGTIPAELENMAALEELSLTRSGLSGEIPAELGNLGALHSLYLQNNNLEGEIPTELGNLSNLGHLDLANNNLEGAVTDIFGGTPEMYILDLRNNNLSGELPESLRALTAVFQVAFDGNGCFTATPELAVWLDDHHRPGGNWDDGCLTINGDMAEGELGKPYAANFTVGDGEEPYMWELVDGPGWMELSASGELSAAMVETAGEHVVTVRVVDQAGRSGEKTDVLEIAAAPGCEDNTTISDLECLALSSLAAATNLGADHGWAGGDPCGWKGVSCTGSGVAIIRISSGSGFPDLTVTGTLPPELRHLHTLDTLAISSQDLTGAMPAELGELTALTSLEIWRSGLTGQIPQELENLTKLRNIGLTGNNLEGPIPDIFAGMTELIVLDLPGNRLSGPVPLSISQIYPKLIIDLKNNGCLTAEDPALRAFLNNRADGWDQGCITITTTSLPDATYQTSYLFSLAVAKGFPLYTWEMLDGPEWLTVFDYGDMYGWVEGEPGEYSVTVKVTDSEGNSAEKTFTLKVNP